MIGFLTISDNPQEKVTCDKIRFVHVPDKLQKDDIRIHFARTAKLFGDSLNVNKVFLHFGKDFIIYDFKV